MSDVQTLSDYAAGEIRATLARKRIAGRDLAAKLGVSRSWVSYRLTGTTEISLNDLDRIADALQVPVADLLPREIAVVGSVADLDRRDVGPNKRLVDVAERPMPAPARCAPDVRSSAGRGGIHRRAKARGLAVQPIAA